MRRFSSTALLVPLVLVMLAGCERGTPSMHTEAVIDAAGGTVSAMRGSATGARIDVPAGAVDAPTHFTIEAGLPDHLASDVRAIGPMITFGPEGSLFAVPVHIVVAASREPMVLLTRPHGSGAWTRVDGAVWDASTGLVSASVTHFSDFVPVERDTSTTGDAGPTDTDAGSTDTDAGSTGTDAGDFCTTHPRDPSCVTTPPPLPGCDALARDCAAGEMCIATDQSSGYDWGMGRAGYCIPAGTLAAGSHCTAPSDCASGTQCVFETMFDSTEGTIWFSQEASYLPMYDSVCMPLCRGPATATGGAGCATGEVCHPVQLWGFSGRDVNDTFGVCAPPPPGSPPR